MTALIPFAAHILSALLWFWLVAGIWALGSLAWRVAKPLGRKERSVVAPPVPRGFRLVTVEEEDVPFDWESEVG